MSGSTVLTTSGFYGSKNKRKWYGIERAVDDVVKKHQSEKIPKSFPNRILGPPTKWQIFYRQQDAFQFVKSTSKDLHVFAFESDCFEGNTGQRLYLVASYPVFWHYYSQLSLDKRHHYEVIPEGAVCKLYFDLEFDRMMNPDADGNDMLKIFVQYVCSCLQSIFKVKCSDHNFLDLDASTETKFSRHLIWQVKTAAFKDNIHAGRFVCSIMSRLYENTRNDKEEQVSNIDISLSDSLEKDRCDSTSLPDNHSEKGSGDHHCMSLSDNHSEKGSSDHHCMSLPDNHSENSSIDVDVELLTGKENAAFEGHLLDMKGQSSKPGAASKFIQMEKKIDEVIGHFDKGDLQKLVVKNKNGDSVSFCDLGVYTKNRNFRLFLSSKLHKRNPLVLSGQNKYTRHTPVGEVDNCSIFYDSLVANVQYCSEMRILTFDEELSSGGLVLTRRRKDKDSAQGNEFLEGHSKSPYPEVDEYIFGLITENGGNGVIRHWTYFHQGELLIYEIAKYRYCHNIGRHHRSNNIMLIADLRRGVLYQKCHDPDCHMQNYKSPEWSLPRTVLPANYFDGDADFDFEEDDEELLKSAIEAEKQYKEDCTQPLDKSELEDGADDDLIAAAAELENSVAENG